MTAVQWRRRYLLGGVIEPGQGVLLGHGRR
jgi:hypothetical protein